MRRRKFLLLTGCAIAAPAIAHAQSSNKVPKIGYLWHAGNPKEESPYYVALMEGFATLGYEDGKSIQIVHAYQMKSLSASKAWQRSSFL